MPLSNDLGPNAKPNGVEPVNVIALEACGVTARLGGQVVLNNVSLQIPKACWTCIVGPNGAGKSTLLKVLAQLLPYTGSVSLAGKSLNHMSGGERARRLSWLGQNESTGDDLSVHDVAMLGRLPHHAWLASPGAADLAAVERALRATQAWDWRGRALGQLSGGERQRVLLARALAVEADVLLMDEPLANLDPPHQADWLALARALVVQGKTVVSVLHEISFALHADNLVILAQGRVTHQGACRDDTSHRALEAVFEHRINVRALGDQWVALPVLPAAVEPVQPQVSSR